MVSDKEEEGEGKMEEVVSESLRCALAVVLPETL